MRMACKRRGTASFADPATASILELQDVLREDEPRPGLDKEDALRNAPDRDGDYFRVQPVFE